MISAFLRFMLLRVRLAGRSGSNMRAIDRQSLVMLGQPGLLIAVLVSVYSLYWPTTRL